MSEVAEMTTTAQSEEIVRSQQSGELKTFRLHIGPKPGDPRFEAWDEEDSMIIAWLWNSMTPEISNTCMFLATTKDIWDAIQQTYSKARDAAQVYEVKVKTIATKQGSKTVTEYANQLKALWQELDHYRVIKTKCLENAAILKDFIEQDRVYDFLVGLNPEFDQVRIQILGKQEVPRFNEVVALIRGEESQRSVMLEPQTLDGSTIVAKTEYSEQGKNNLPKHLETKAHKEKCWKLNGKPPSREWRNRGGQQRPQAHMSEQPKTEENSATGGFNSEEMEKLRSLLGSLDKLTGTCSLALSAVSTPMDPNHKLGEAKEEPMVDKRMYQRLVGRLIYLAHTWPDIAYSVSVISQFMHDPREPHLQAAYKVLHYLKNNPGKGILFKKNNTLALEAYTDADYAGSLVDRRSTTGYFTFLGGNLVTWRSKKQNVVARSSAESEFRIIAQGLCELLWLKIILDDLRIKWDGPMKLYCDNKSAINIAHNLYNTIEQNILKLIDISSKKNWRKE
ncbi:Retrovirus-related Pol polyprotein from transposon RE1 [Vitis vinifera]|uniref:Retrovirus-related Pol polyprotein from transposon RE1 n=1 Tax=Vitis vinifera TaxID=29760 RepID=A0A438DXS0_VITVI|nr:Retrovirus-related Pol polyprotein from transposon RE1 [Vitis vinifera]